MFIGVAGALENEDAGDCAGKELPADWLIACRPGMTGKPLPSVGASPPSAAPAFAIGSYMCESWVDGYQVVSGVQETAAGGGKGTLILSQAGSVVTAKYSGDAYAAGTLSFDVASSSAVGEASQELLVPCQTPFSMTASPPMTPEKASIGASALTALDGKIFLSFLGTMGAGVDTCPGAEVGGTLLCTKQ